MISVATRCYSIGIIPCFVCKSEFYFLHWRSNNKSMEYWKDKIINIVHLNINIKTTNQYLILDPSAFITNAIRLSIGSKLLPIFSERSSIFILLTIPENCSKDSICIHLNMVSFFSSMLTSYQRIWKISVLEWI